MEDGTRSASRLFNISDIHAIQLWEEHGDNDCCYLTTSHWRDAASTWRLEPMSRFSP